MKRLFVTALLASAAIAHAQTAASGASGASGTSGASAPASPAKKELVQKLLVLQQSGIETMARNIVERDAMGLLQEAGQVLQQQVPPEKREAAGKAIQADVKKYVDDSTPIVRDRAVKLAPSTIGATLEEKFTEDELRQLIAWFESPTNKKFAQVAPEMQNNFAQKLIADVRPTIEPRLQALTAKVRANLGTPPVAAPAKASAPKKAASK
jgi:hypothetical protein